MDNGSAPTAPPCSLDVQLTCKDFLPPVGDDGRFAASSFRSLVESANEWLHENRSWEVLNCETVEFRLASKGSTRVDADSLTSTDKGQFLVALRVWLLARDAASTSETSDGETADGSLLVGSTVLDFVDVVPGADMQSDTGLEEISTLVRRFNVESSAQQRRGHLLNVHTLTVNYGGGSSTPNVQPTVISRAYGNDYLVVLRVFFLHSDTPFPLLACKHFIPSRKRTHKKWYYQFEHFSTLLAEVNEWLASSDVSVLSLQSIETRVRTTGSTCVDVAPQRTKLRTYAQSITHEGERTVETLYFAICLRVFFTAVMGDVAPRRTICAKAFLPYRLCKQEDPMRYESVYGLRGRIAKWQAQCRPQMLCLETRLAQLYSGGPQKESRSESMLYSKRSDDAEYVMRYVRAFYFASAVDANTTTTEDESRRRVSFDLGGVLLVDPPAMDESAAVSVSVGEEGFFDSESIGPMNKLKKRTYCYVLIAVGGLCLFVLCAILIGVLVHR